MANYSIAKLYDFLLYPFLNNIRKKVAKVIIQLNPESLIDICCGTGNQLKFLKDSSIKLTGIDNSKAMLKVSGNINCYEQDARNIEFKNDSFDMAIIQLALHEKTFEDQKKIIDEAYRIIKSKGHLLILDYEINSNTSSFSRNMIHFIEYLAGKEHYTNFKQFHVNHCTHKIIEPNQFILKKKMFIGGKSMAIQILQKQSN